MSVWTKHNKTTHNVHKTHCIHTCEDENSAGEVMEYKSKSLFPRVRLEPCVCECVPARRESCAWCSKQKIYMHKDVRIHVNNTHTYQLYTHTY
jgi:hypothetical protein